MATYGENNYPNIRAMEATQSEGLRVLWFITGANADKTKELQKNPKCTVYSTTMEDNQNYVEIRLYGSVEILNDSASRAANWKEGYKAYFPGGKDDPSLRVLKFTTHSGTLQTAEGIEKLDY